MNKLSAIIFSLLAAANFSFAQTEPSPLDAANTYEELPEFQRERDSAPGISPRFGVRPTVRGLATSGPYRFVRHPKYLSYILADIGYNLEERNLVTLLLVLVGWAALFYRIYAEERVLSQHSGWQVTLPRSALGFSPVSGEEAPLDSRASRLEAWAPLVVPSRR
jgi:Isoprenylcysteine carboxyl methyltransferase (ICMT) family